MAAIQKNLEGLLKSVVYQVLEKSITIQRDLHPLWRKWRDGALRHGSEFHRTTTGTVLRSTQPESDHGSEFILTISQLNEGFTKILEQRSVPLRITLFVDALDEYDGIPERMVDFVKDTVRKRSGSFTQIRIMFTSRPWETFKDNFRLQLGSKCMNRHRKTWSIMSHMLKSNVSINNILTSPHTNVASTAEELKQSLIDRAQGVFLWIRLVLGIYAA